MAIIKRSGHWSRTRREMWVALIIWFILGFAIHIFVFPVSSWSFIGFPINYYLAAQGSIIGFVILIFWHSSRQENVDREYGVSEDI